MKKRIATTNNSKKTYSKFQKNAVMICTFIGAMAIAEGTLKLCKKAKSAAENKKNQEVSKKDTSATTDSYDPNYNKLKSILDFVVNEEETANKMFKDIVDVLDDSHYSDVEAVCLAIDFKREYQDALKTRRYFDEVAVMYTEFKKGLIEIYGYKCNYKSLFDDAWHILVQRHIVNWETGPIKVSHDPSEWF